MKTDDPLASDARRAKWSHQKVNEKRKADVRESLIQLKHLKLLFAACICGKLEDANFFTCIYGKIKQGTAKLMLKAQSCPICQEDYENGQEIVKLPCQVFPTDTCP